MKKTIGFALLLSIHAVSPGYCINDDLPLVLFDMKSVPCGKSNINYGGDLLYDVEEGKLEGVPVISHSFRPDSTYTVGVVDILDSLATIRYYGKEGAGNPPLRVVGYTRSIALGTGAEAAARYARIEGEVAAAAKEVPERPGEGKKFRGRTSGGSDVEVSVREETIKGARFATIDMVCTAELQAAAAAEKAAAEAAKKAVKPKK